ncbi:MAG: hypothetical protein ACFFE2_13245 [Candidatus Thorarchaeota archaeon]
MSILGDFFDRRKLVGLLVVIVVILGFFGFVGYIHDIPTTYHYETWLPNSDKRDTRITITGLTDANITVSYVDEPGLWYRMDITHYDSTKRHAVENVTDPSFFPLRVHVTSVTPVKRLDLFLGTDVAHSLYISGTNLNTKIILDNGAKLSGSRCRFYGTGTFQFFMTDDVNFTEGGMDVKVGDFFTDSPSTELVIVDVNLPAGLNGRLSSPNVSFVQNEWPVKYGQEWGTILIDEPLLDIEIYSSLKVWANLLM